MTDNWKARVERLGSPSAAPALGALLVLPPLLGLAAQFVLAPTAPAWGFYEVAGFAVAGLSAASYAAWLVSRETLPTRPAGEPQERTGRVAAAVLLAGVVAGGVWMTVTPEGALLAAWLRGEI